MYAGQARCFTLCALGLLTLSASAPAVIIDRIAVVVNNRPIKDSDIDRDIRLTAYLNGDPVNLTPAERKKAVQRLIDQEIIRREVEVGNYQGATPSEVDQLLKGVGNRGTGAYGLTSKEVRDRLAWQITVLHFIEQRFRPAVMVTEEEINKYARTHAGMSREQIQEQLAGERVNQEFSSWLDRAQKRTKIEYHEPGLQYHEPELQ